MNEYYCILIFLVFSFILCPLFFFFFCSAWGNVRMFYNIIIYIYIDSIRTVLLVTLIPERSNLFPRIDIRMTKNVKLGRRIPGKVYSTDSYNIIGFPSRVVSTYIMGVHLNKNTYIIMS